MKITIRFFLLSMMLLLVACGDNHAVSQSDNLDGTLANIKHKGFIALGYSADSIPFSYVVNGQDVPQGFAHDLELKIVDAIKQKLAMPNLKVKYQGINMRNRLSLVNTGMVDLECTATTNNFKRKNRVDFSVGFFYTTVRLLVKKDSAIEDFADLQDKTVLTKLSSTAETQLRVLNNKGLNTTIIAAEDNEGIIAKLENGDADALMMDDVLLANIKEQLSTQDWQIVGHNDKYEIYGCSFQKDDEQFKALVDETLIDLYQSGEIKQLYHKWFESAVLPNNVNMHFPMSLELQELYQNPHDKELVN